MWDTVVACQKMPFWTYSGLPFTYELHRGRDGAYTKELWIDRRENSKSLAWSSVLLAFAGVKAGKIAVKRPKELGDIRGISYGFCFRRSQRPGISADQRYQRYVLWMRTGSDLCSSSCMHRSSKEEKSRILRR